MKAIGKRALALLASSLFGAALWLAIFIAIIVGFEHLPGQQDVGVIGRAFVEGGGFILAGMLGVAAAVYVLRRFRPGTSSR